MSKDLISRKALVAELIKEREKFPPETIERYSLGVKLPNRFNQAIRGGIRKALRLVETAPAIDAEPVRHCKFCEDLDVLNQIVCYLPRENGSETAVSINFCPNCGVEVQDDG